MPVDLNKLPAPVRTPGLPPQPSPLFMPRPPAGPFHIPGLDPNSKGTVQFQNSPVGGPVYTGQPHPAQGVLAHPVTPPATPGASGGAGTGAGTGSGAASSGSPYLDSTALMNIANNDFRVNNLIAGLQQREAYGNDDLQRALLQLTHSAALQERQDREQANNAGLLSSTALAGTLGEHARSAGDQRTSLQTQNSRSNASILSQIKEAQGGQRLFDQAQQLAAAQRQAAADAANPALGEPLPGAPSGPSGPPLSVAAVNAINAANSGNGSLNPGGQIYRPRTNAQGQLLPPAAGQPPLVRSARLPPTRAPARRPPPFNTNKGY